MVLNGAISFLADAVVWNTFFSAAVLGCGIFFCVAFRMRHVTGLLNPRRIFAPSGGGRIRPFDIFSLTLGGKIGVGNIVGVGLALRTGGAGAVLWMAIFAVAGAALSYAECRLGARVGGGPPEYMRRLGWKRIAAVFSVLIFTVQAVFMPAIQINSAALAITGLWGGSGPLRGAAVAAVLALLFLLCCLGGERKITSAAAKLTTPAALLYMLIAIGVIAVNFRRVPEALGEIFTQGLSVRAAAGGGIATAFSVGLKRAAFTGEAGCGIAPYAAAKADSDPDSQGLAQSLSVLIDTLVMCGLTALMLLTARTTDPTEAVACLLGSAAPAVVAAFTVLFAFTTVLCCGFVAAQPFEGIRRAAVLLLTAGVMVCAGAAAPQAVWGLCDISCGLMMRLNIAAVVADTLKYRQNNRPRVRKKRSARPLRVSVDDSD